MSSEWDIDGTMRDMLKLDSFFLPCFQCRELRARVRAAAARYGLGIKVVDTTEDMIKGLRIWRVT
jgi:hypothetical protein